MSHCGLSNVQVWGATGTVTSLQLLSMESTIACEGGLMVDSLLGDRSSKTPGSGLNRRLMRTIVLGTVAVAFAIYWLADAYEVDTEELLSYLRTSLAFVLLFVVAGVLGGLLLRGLRRLRNR
jgi:hypothetical protein